MRGRAVVEERSVPSPRRADFALHAGDDALEFIGGLGDARAGLGEAIDERGAGDGIIGHGDAERIERGVGGERDAVEIRDRARGEILEVRVFLEVNLAVGGERGGEFVARGRERAGARDTRLGREGLIAVETILRGGGGGGVEDGRKHGRGSVHGERARGGGGARGDDEAGDGIGRADGGDEGAGVVAVGEEEELWREFAV